MKRTPMRHGAATLAVALLALSACGRDADTKSTDTGDDGDTTSTESGGGFIDPAQDCSDYDGTAGITGDTIKIGTVRPASGPYAIYDTVTKGLEALVTATNSKGGVKAGDGKTYKLELVKGDDGYDPARTPAEVERLVDQEKVFAIVGEIGTSNNLAVRQTLNDKCIPSIGLATGSTEWGKAKEYPWFIGGLPSYATEAHHLMEWLKKEKPAAKIALLYQDDDFGKAYQASIETSIEGSDITVVAEESFNPLTETSPESKVAALSASGADVFFVGIGGSPCPAAVKAVPANWTPLTLVSVTCTGKLAMALAGGKDEGLVAVQATYDPGTAADQSNPKIKAFFDEGGAAGLSQGDLEGGIATAGWGFGSMFVKGLELTDTVDRASLMNALWQLDGVNYGLMLDDAKASTKGGDDPWVIEDLRIVKRQAGSWNEIAPLTSYDGTSNDFAG